MGRDDDLDRLYGAPLEEFVAERNQLARRLRSEGERERAEEVRRLRRPSRSAWALNQGIRTDPSAATRLLEAGERLEAAQEEALGGGSGPELRDAMASHHDAVEGMLSAVESAGKGRLSPAVVDRVRETLRAVAGDPDLRGEFAAGRVTRDRRAVGLGAAAGASRPRRAAAKAERRPSAAKRRRAERLVDRAERDLDGALRRVEAAKRKLERAQRQVGAAQVDLDSAEAQARERRTAVDDARSALEDLG